MLNEKIVLKISDEGDVAYVSLRSHPGIVVPGVVVKQIPLRELLKNYKGPDIVFDCDESDEIIGIEIDISEHDK